MNMVALANLFDPEMVALVIRAIEYKRHKRHLDQFFLPMRWPCFIYFLTSWILIFSLFTSDLPASRWIIDGYLLPFSQSRPRKSTMTSHHQNRDQGYAWYQQPHWPFLAIFLKWFNAKIFCIWTWIFHN